MIAILTSVPISTIVHFMKKSIGRPKSFDKDEVLQKAMEYFWEHGYDKSSLNKLLNVMGIKKSSFYQTFESKEHIFRLCLELYTKSSKEYLFSLKEKKGGKGVLLHIVYSTIKELKETGRVKGCLLMSSGSECYISHPHFNELIRYEFKTFQKLFCQFIEMGQKNGDIKNQTPPFVLGSIYQSLINGLVLMIQVGAKERALEAVVKHIEELLE